MSGWNAFLDGIRRRGRLLGISTGIGVVIAGLLYFALPAHYASSVTFYISTSSVANGTADNGQFAQGRVASYLQVLASERLIQQVAVSTNQSVSTVRRNVAATSQADTVVITATATATDPETALAMARSIRAAFPTLVTQLDNPGQSGAGVRINVISPPQLASEADFPVLWQFGLIGILGGLLIGGLIALALEAGRSVPRNAEAVESMTGLPVLARIPERARRRSSSPPARTARAEAYRQLAVALSARLPVAAAHHSDVIGTAVVVTSAQPSDGRTSTTVNLAAAWASRGDRTLVIDADPSNPQIAVLCGVEPAPHLKAALEGAAFEDAVQPSDAGFDVVSSALQPGGSTAVVSSARMIDLLGWAREHYDLVLVDSAPLPQISDSSALALAADGLLLCVRENTTRRSALLDCLRVARNLDAPVLGAVLTMHRLTRAERAEYLQTGVNV